MTAREVAWVGRPRLKATWARARINATHVTCYLTGRDGEVVAVQMGTWKVVPSAAGP